MLSDIQCLPSIIYVAISAFILCPPFSLPSLPTFNCIFFPILSEHVCFVSSLISVFVLVSDLQLNVSNACRWASQVALVVQNPLAMQKTWETRVRSLGWEDSPEEGMATYSSVLAWRIYREAWWATVHGVARVGHGWNNLAQSTNTMLAASLLVDSPRRAWERDIPWVLADLNLLFIAWMLEGRLSLIIPIISH